MATIDEFLALLASDPYAGGNFRQYRNHQLLQGIMTAIDVDGEKITVHIDHLHSCPSTRVDAWKREEIPQDTFSFVLVRYEIDQGPLIACKTLEGETVRFLPWGYFDQVFEESPYAPRRFAIRRPKD